MHAAARSFSLLDFFFFFSPREEAFDMLSVLVL